MYIDISNNNLIDKKSVVGVFDLDNTTTNKYTNAFLKKKQDEGKIIYFVSDIPKSFILTDDGMVYVVEVSSQIIKKRFESL